MAPLIVVDTNVFVSGLLTERGNAGLVITAWLAGRVRLVVPEPQSIEIADVTSRAKFASEFHEAGATVAELLNELRAAEVIVPLVNLPVPVRDPDDEALLAVALAEGADYLVSGDKDLLVLNGDPRLGALRIVTPRAFLEELNQLEREATAR